MPTTRSQAAEEEKLPRRHDIPPASPSALATASVVTDPTVPLSRTVRVTNMMTATAATDRTATEPAPLTSTNRTVVAATSEGRQRAPSVRSERSTASAVARIRQAELEAEEQLAEIRRQELQLQATLVRKRLAADVATIREETDRESADALETTDVEGRVNDWLQGAEIRGERRHREPEEMDPGTCRPQPLPPRQQEATPIPSRVRFEPRARSPTPTRSRDRGIDRLADVLERMARTRAPSRQTQDLPTFNGAPGEWLPFKAAMSESTHLHGFSPAENLARLRACLKGEARESVAALLYTASNPKIIMRTLEQCYGRPEIIIDKALNDIRKLPRPGTSASDLNAFAVKLQNIVGVLSCIDERGYLQNPMLARQVIEKLSPHIRARWCDYADEYGSRDEPEVVTLSRFLMREADRAVRFAYSTTASATREPTRHEIATRTGAPQQVRPKVAYQRKEAAVYATTNAPSRKVCICCGNEHNTTDCKKVHAMTVNERWDWAKGTRVCFRCLNSRHRRATCKAKKCGIEECRHAHHALLHNNKHQAEPMNETTTEEETATITVAHAASEHKSVWLKVCPITIRGPDGLKMDTYALLDEGSTITLIDEEVAHAVNAHGPQQTLKVSGVTSTRSEPGSQRVRIEIKGMRTNFHPIEARTIKSLDISAQTITADQLKRKHLNGLRPEDVCYANAKPRVLIGADNWHLIVSRHLLTGPTNEPVASLTRLGWVVHGTLPRTIVAKETDEGETVLHTRIAERPEPNARDAGLDELVTSHFAIDALGISTRTKPVREDERAKEIFEKTVRLTDGHYEVGLPWRTEEARLPPSYDMAARRLRTLERKMDQSAEFRKAYTDQMNNLFVKGYAVPVENANEDDPHTWYLPHFAVTNPNKPGKVRLVFDAAARTNGSCLNDELLAGPDMLLALYGVLFRFRERAVAVTADIREMFLRIKIRPEDRVAQRFLWRADNRNDPPRKYEMTSMIFGAKSSPFLAHSVRNRNADECAATHPRALHSITTNHYMDDWLESFIDEESAARAIVEVRDVHRRAGFELAGWNTNRPHLLEHVSDSKGPSAPKELCAGAHPYGRTLGLIWIPDTDELGFNTAMHRVPNDVRSGSRTPTKREMLSAVMSIYDPLGLLSPYTIHAKITLQELWRKKTGWDEPVPDEEAEDFHDWLTGLQAIERLRLPRCYATHQRPEKERELHVFVDASEQAYAAAAYWRLRHDDGHVTIVLVAGKAKVAPMKAQSIPRLELQACLIGARLAAEVQREHTETSRTVFWSDSKTALHWIRNDSSRYTPYVAHRLSEIAELTKVDQWRWVPTTQNVADDATRNGTNLLTTQDRWFHGPPFLRKPPNEWPVETAEHPTQDEEMVAHVNENKGLVDVCRFSSYDRLLRTIAYVLLFVDKCKRREKEMQVSHMVRAERVLLKEAQRDSFATEIDRLAQRRNIDRTSRLYRLDPKLNGDGLLCLNGRINAATVPDELKEPPILDGAHALTRLMIKREHEKNSHVGREQIVNTLRQRYWILRVRPTVRKILRHCTWCKIRRGTPATPVKGNLPSARVSAFTRPFSHCGIDCFGPMWVTIGRRKEKRWGLLATCLVTRAIHVELIPSLSTDSAIMALRRMAARRGWPAVIYSDNGTNFRGASSELHEAYEGWLPHFRNYAATNKIQWKFIDPGAPNQGGAWERLIKSVKSALLVTLKERAPKEEVLQTLLAEIENTVNSRPLTHVAVNPDDPEALTPNHFLLGTATGLPHVGDCDLADKRQWRAAQALSNMFWTRWMKEYLPTLNPRGDHRGPNHPPEEGDVVIIADGLLPRNVWPRGQIERVYTGPDGVVRSADVRTRGGIFRRPVRRLIVLPREEEAA